jgi:hypothetical protein
MASENRSLASSKDNVLKEMARYLSSHLQRSRTKPAVKLSSTHGKAGVFRRALIDSLTADDVRRLCDAAIRADEGASSR